MRSVVSAAMVLVLVGYAVLVLRAMRPSVKHPAPAGLPYEQLPLAPDLWLELGKAGELGSWRLGDDLYWVELEQFDGIRVEPESGKGVPWSVFARDFATAEIRWPETTEPPGFVSLYLTDDARGLRNLLIARRSGSVVAGSLYPGRWISLAVDDRERAERRVHLVLRALTGDDASLSAIIAGDKDAAR